MDTVTAAAAATPVIESVTCYWHIKLSFEDFREDHNYRFADWHRLGKFATHELASAYAEKEYGTGAYKSSVAYQLRSETVTTEVIETVTDGLKRVKRVVTSDTEEFPVVYRDFADYEKSVLMPREEARLKRVESGEEAVQQAWADEVEENHLREQRGEAPVYDAEKAWYEFNGYHPLKRHLETPMEPKSFLGRLLNRRPQ
jgi:hypothetical protein